MSHLNRVSVNLFALDNPYYANAVVYAYTVDEDGQPTTTLADLYADSTGEDLVENPQMLSSRGRWQQFVYVEDPIILKITGLSTAPDHYTGMIGNLVGDILAQAQIAADSATASAFAAEEFAVRAKRATSGYVLKTGDVMSGRLRVPNGSAAAAGLALGADDRGIYSESSGIGITTAGVVGLFQDSAQRIGIGTIAPDITTLLHIKKDQAAASTNILIENDGAAGISALNLTTSTGPAAIFQATDTQAKLRAGSRDLLIQLGALSSDYMTMYGTPGAAGAIELNRGTNGVPAMRLPTAGQYMVFGDAGLIQSSPAAGIGGTYFGHGLYYHAGVGAKYLKTGEAGALMVPGTSPSLDFYTFPSGTADGAVTLHRQFQIAHVLNAVNYLSLAGAASGTPILLSAAGSDANVAWRAQTKGTGSFSVEIGSAGIALIVQATGAGAEPDRLAIQSDTGRGHIIGNGASANIDIRVTPKGAGVLDVTGPSGTTVGAAGGASALPATPLGYLSVKIGGTAAKIPYYNT